jgi:hypothetical protein
MRPKAASLHHEIMLLSNSPPLTTSGATFDAPQRMHVAGEGLVPHV